MYNSDCIVPALVLKQLHFLVFQEYHIGGSDHCSKGEFMDQLIKYNTDCDLVQAVFFSKVGSFVLLLLGYFCVK